MPDFSKLLIGGLIVGSGLFLLSASSKAKDETADLMVGGGGSQMPDSPLSGLESFVSGFFSQPSGVDEMFSKKGGLLTESPSLLPEGQAAFSFDDSTSPVLSAMGNVESLNRQLNREVFTSQTDVWGAVFDINPAIKKNLNASEVKRFMDIPFTGLDVIKSESSSGSVTVFDEPQTILQRITTGSSRGGGVSKKEAESNTRAINESVSQANEFRSAAKSSGFTPFGG